MTGSLLRLYHRSRNHILSLYRIVVGLLFAAHGAASLFDYPANAAIYGHPAFGAWPSWYAALIELLGGLLVMVGAGTRVAAVLSSGTMAYAYFTVHVERALWPIQNGGEAAAMFCWAFLTIAIIGPGPLSIDALIARMRRAVPARRATPTPETAG